MYVSNLNNSSMNSYLPVLHNSYPMNKSIQEKASTTENDNKMSTIKKFNKTSTINDNDNKTSTINITSKNVNN